MDASFLLFSLCLFFLLFRYLCFYVLYALFIAFFWVSLLFCSISLFFCHFSPLYFWLSVLYLFSFAFSEDRLRQAQGKKGVRQIWAGGRLRKGQRKVEKQQR